MRRFGYWLQDNFLALIGFIGLAIIIVIVAIIFGSKKLKQDSRLFISERNAFVY